MVKSFGSGDWDSPRLATPDARREGHSLPGHQNWKHRLVNMMIAKLSSRHELHKMDPPIKLTPEMFEIKGPVQVHHTYSGAAYPPHAQTVDEMELEYIRSMEADVDMDLL